MKEHLNKIVQEAEGYASAKLEQKSLDAVEKSVDILTGVLSWLVVAGIALFVMAFISIIGVYLIASLTGGILSACAIILGFYLTVFVLLLVFNKRLLSRPIKNFLLGEYLRNYKMK